MTFNEFDKVREEINAKIAEISKSKGVEYSRSEDRLDNFKRIASKNRRISALDALHVLLTKHLDSIDSYVERGKVISGERIQGRIIDAILYLQLMYALVEEMERVPIGESAQQATNKIGYGELGKR